MIPPPPPLPPGTVVPKTRILPPAVPASRALAVPGDAPAGIPAAPPMPLGMGYANTPIGFPPGPQAVGLPPPPPPLPPGTIIPQGRLIPPTAPHQANSLGMTMPPAVAVSAAVSAAPAVAKRVLERPANGENVKFPSKVSYYVGAEDLAGDKEKGVLRLKDGQMAVVYNTDDPHWWLGKVGDDVGWIASSSLQEINPKATGRQQHVPPQDVSRRTWGSKKKEAHMAAGELDMEKTDFSMTTATTFDHHGAKITAFFIQVSGVRKSEKEEGDIWVVAKTLKAFNRLRVAWEEDYGTTSIPVEPPPARWADCSESDWKDLKGAALRKFLEEVKQWPNLKHSQDLKHFLTTDRVNLSGGIISKKTMKPYLDAWIKTSSEPTWTLQLPPIPSKESADGGASTPAIKTKDKKAAIPGLRAGDESFGHLTSQRPKLRRSRVFGKVSALAAVTKQEAMLETSRRGWTHAGLKLQLLTQGGDACSLKRRSERNIFYKYYAEDGPGADLDSFGKMAGSRALMKRGGYNQMKSHMRYNLERVVYGRLENIARESEIKYAVYAKQKEQEKMQKDGGTGAMKRGIVGGGRGAGAGGQKKSSLFQLEALTERLDKVNKVVELQQKPESTLDRCQYMSRIHGRFTMPVAAQLMALNELGSEELEQFLVNFGEAHEGGQTKLGRMKELDSFLEDKRVRCHQVVELLDRMRTPDERLLVVLTCCARLTDAVEADDQGLFKDLEGAIDALNLKRARLMVEVLVAEAQAEDASRASRKATREVHADVQRARKALGFLSKAVEKIRSGTIAAGMFEELKERLEAAADAAHEEYCDAVKDAKPANEYAEQAVSLMEAAERLFEDLDDLGTGVKDRVKVVHNGGGGTGGLEAADTEETLIVSALEVVLTIASNAHELSARAADNARLDMQSALEEVATAEKIIRRVELEERRARTECDAAEGNEEETELGECKFGEWAADAKLHGMENLERFRKAGKYRLHMDKAGMTGSEDMLMMATLISKVQLLRDLRVLQAEAEAEELKRQESLLQSSSKRRQRTTATKREDGATAPVRHAPLRQQSSLGGDSTPTAGGAAAAAKKGPRSALMRRQSDLFPVEEVEGGEGVSSSRRRKGGMGRKGGKEMGEIEDQLDEEDEDSASSDDNEGSGSDDDDDDDDDDDGTTSSSEVDSVFGSDLDAGDDDLGPLRKSAVRRSRTSSGGHRGSGGAAANGRNGTGAGRTTRRHDKMRQSLIGKTLGKRGSIGTKSIAKNLAPSTPRPEARSRRQQQSRQFHFPEEGEEGGERPSQGDDDDFHGDGSHSYVDGSR